MAATLPVGSSDGRKSFISGWIGRSFLCLSALILHVKLLSSTLVRFPPSPPLVSLSLFPFQSLNTPRFHCPGEGAPGKAPQAGRPRAYSRHFGVISEVILASFLGLIRVIFASYWSHFSGHFLVIFASFLRHFCVIFASFLRHFCVILESFFGSIFWSYLSHIWVILGSFWGSY